MEGIQFIANLGDWVSVKKLKVEEATEPKTIMEFLASLNTGIDRKVEENLRKLVALDKVDKAVEEAVAGNTKGEAGVAAVLAFVKGNNLGKVLNEICELPQFQKGEKDELKDFCRAYATKKALGQVGLMVDYSGIKIPGMKKLLRKKG